MKLPGRPSPVSRILILRAGAIGDFILTLPALAAVRRTWPDAHIELAGYPQMGALAVSGGLVNTVVSLDNAEFARLFAIDAQLPAKQVQYIRLFDLIVSYLNDSDGIVRRNLVAGGARRLVCGSARVTDRHAINALLGPLEEVGIRVPANACSQLRLSDPQREGGRRRAADLGEKVVVLHPGSGSPKKNWPLKRFLVLADRLRAETPLTPVFTLGEADEEIARELRSLASPIAVLPPCSLLDLAGFLSAGMGYVGNDSGITHLAAALGIPVVALFGPTNPRLWAPRGPNVTVLKSDRPAEGLSAITADQVFDTLLEISRLIPSAPASPRGEGCCLSVPARSPTPSSRGRAFRSPASDPA